VSIELYWLTMDSKRESFEILLQLAPSHLRRWLLDPNFPMELMRLWGSMRCACCLLVLNFWVELAIHLWAHMDTR